MTSLKDKWRQWRQGLPRAFYSPRFFVWEMRNLLAPNMPLKATLPWGSQWLALNDFIGVNAYCGYYFEGAQQNFLLRYLQEGMTVLDVGAHHGFYTLLAATKVGRSGKVVAFEPSPREMGRLKNHLALNAITNTSVEPIALGSAKGEAELYVCLGPFTGHNSLRAPEVEDPTTKITVPVLPLDEYLTSKGIKKVDCIKLDVEGGELEFLRGAQGLFTGDARPLLLYEIQEIRTKPWGYDAHLVYDLLASWNYQSFYVSGEGDLIPCAKKETYDDNLIAVPAEKVQALKAFMK